mmetsp:Transcript_22954/g.74333  ORF Transcript_22954/g.74333 Transcript_22954/m.74333 type:complete len:303 (+) Transcript_22954:58-966(+)
MPYPFLIDSSLDPAATGLVSPCLRPARGAALRIVPRADGVELSIAPTAGVQLSISTCQPSEHPASDAVRLTIDVPRTAGTAPCAATQPPRRPPLQPPSDECISPSEMRVRDAAAALGMSSARFVRVPAGYYDQPLEWRARVVGVDSTARLCKSVIMENTRLSRTTGEGPTAGAGELAGRHRYVCVIQQYDGPRLDRDLLTAVVQELEGQRALGRKKYNLRLVPQHESNTLSGFAHNAVSPIGMATPMPVVLSRRVAEMGEEGGTVALGAGGVDYKVVLRVDELLRGLSQAPGFGVTVADVVR